MYLKTSKVGLKSAMCTTRLCDLYLNGKFKTNVLNKGSIMEQSNNSIRLTIKDLVEPGKHYQGIPLLLKEPDKYSVSSVLELMRKVKKGSGEYRIIVASSVKEIYSQST